MSARLLRISLVAFSSALVAAACGGDGGTAPPPPPPPPPPPASPTNVRVVSAGDAAVTVTVTPAGIVSDE